MIIDEHLQGRPGLLVLTTPSAQALGTFYRGLFGWEVTEAEGGVSTLELDGRVVGAVRSGDRGWLPYLSVAELDQGLTAATAAGATVATGPTTDALGRHAVVVDPASTQLGLWEIGSAAGLGRMVDVGSVVWLEQKVRAQAPATDFLAAVFGFRVVGPEGPGKVRALLPAQQPSFAGVMQFDDRWAPDHPAHWLLYFHVADVDATIAGAERLGGSLWFPPTDTPLGLIAYIRDPDGNPWAVVSVSERGRSMIGI